jgi:hypothetical protein
MQVTKVTTEIKRSCFPLTQIAFGITGLQTNPDFLKMMEYCRAIGIIPNFTLSGIDLTLEIAEKCAKLIGAVAVSAYQKDKNVCYNAVKIFTDLGIKQTNIHLLIAQENEDFVYEVIEDRVTDPRLAKMNAIVFLGVKPKGRAKVGFSPLPANRYARLVDHCLRRKIAFGFDSCSAPKFEAAVRDMPMDENRRKQMIQLSESCESGLFSAYINVAGEYWHCSFAEREPEQEPINVVNSPDFLRDVWYNPAVVAFRAKSLDTAVNGCRHCTIFPQINL